MANGFWAELADIDTVRRVADIAGPSSAASKALAQLQSRLDAGEDVVLLKTERSFLVALKDQITNVTKLEKR